MVSMCSWRAWLIKSSMVARVVDFAPCRPGHQNQPAWLFTEFRQQGRQLQLFKGLDFKRDHPEHSGHGATLIEQVAPESRHILDPKREVELKILFKTVLLPVGQDAIGQLLGIRRTERWHTLERFQLAMKANSGRGVRGNMQVGTSRINHPLQKIAKTQHWHRFALPAPARKPPIREDTL